MLVQEIPSGTPTAKPTYAGAVSQAPTFRASRILKHRIHMKNKPTLKRQQQENIPDASRGKAANPAPSDWQQPRSHTRGRSGTRRAPQAPRAPPVAGANRFSALADDADGAGENPMSPDAAAHGQRAGNDVAGKQQPNSYSADMKGKAAKSTPEDTDRDLQMAIDASLSPVKTHRQHPSHVGEAGPSGENLKTAAVAEVVKRRKVGTPRGEDASQPVHVDEEMVHTLDADMVGVDGSAGDSPQ
jgi:hypothetical protein